MILRKIIIPIALLMIIGISQPVYAVQSSADDLKKALYYSITALVKTDNYLSEFNNQEHKKKYEYLLNAISICEYEQKSLEAILNQSDVGGTEARNCIFAAMVILQERGLTLRYMRDAINAKVRNDEQTYEYYLNEAIRYAKSAEELRQQFKQKYGY